MDEGAKRRLVGAAVLVALAVIFVPMLLDEKDADGLGEPIVISDSPAFNAADSDAGRSVDTGTADDLTPRLPSPESPSEGVGQGLDAADGSAPLRAPPPPQEAVSIQPPPRIEQPAAEPPVRPVRPAPQPAPATARSAVAGPKPVPAGSPAWVVQVSSLGSSAAATKLQDELRGKGYPAFVEQATVNGKRYFRVRVGPETSRATANSVADRLQRETGNKPLVQSYR